MELNKINIQKLLTGYFISLFLIFTVNNGFYGWYYHFYLLALNLMLTLFLLIKEDKLAAEFKPSPFLNSLIVLILALLLVQVILSPYTYRSFSVFVKVYNFIILFYIVCFFVKKESLGFLFYAIVATGFLTSIYGLYDGYFRDFNHVSGAFVNKNIFAGLIALSISLLFSTFLWHEDKKIKTVSIFLVVPIILALIFSGSRGALFALFFSLAVVSYFKSKKLTLLLLSLLLLISATALLFTNYIYIFRDVANISGRFSTWGTTLKVIADNFLTGTGPGMYEEFIKMYDYSIIKSWNLRYAYFPNYAHNEYLQIFSDGGIFLFLAGTVLVSVIAYKAVKNRKNVSNANQKYFYGFLGVYLTILFHSLVECTVEFYPVTLAFAVSSAALLKLSAPDQEGKYENPLKNVKFTIFVSSLVGIVISVIIIVSGYFYETGNSFVSKDIDKAVNSLKTAVKLNPFNAAYHALLADAYIYRTNVKKTDEFAYAALEYGKAVRLNRYKSEYYFKLASMNRLAYGNKKEELFLKDAIRYFKKSIELDPYNAQYYQRFGEFYLENEMLNDALSYFKKASATEPYYAKSHYFQARALINAGRYIEGGEKLFEALQVNEKLKRGLEKTYKSPFNEITLKDYEKEMASIDYHAVYTSLAEIEKASGNKAEEKKWKEMAEKVK